MSGTLGARRRVALHHEQEGAGPPLLLAGSLGADLSMWNPNVARLAGARRVIRFDTRGHGRSPAPSGPYSIADLGHDVLGLLDELGFERASYCGLSLGGMVGLWLAANAPERIDRLVVACTSAHLPPASGWAERAAAVRAAGTTAAVAETVLGRWLTEPFAAANPEVTATLRAMLLATDPEGYAACCAAIERMDLRAELGGIAAPTLVVAGSEDRATPLAHGREIADAIPGARLEIVPGAHLASVECANAIDGLVIDHLREQP